MRQIRRVCSGVLNFTTPHAPTALWVASFSWLLDPVSAQVFCAGRPLAPGILRGVQLGVAQWRIREGGGALTLPTSRPRRVAPSFFLLRGANFMANLVMIMSLLE
jgi:hypothetical protein